MNKSAQMNEKADEKTINRPDPVITDLNLTIAQLKMSGMTNTQIANKLNLTLPDITYHLKRVNNLIELKADGKIDDPINSHRARIQRTYKKIEQVYEHIFKPGSPAKDDKDEKPGWKNNFQRLRLAKDLAVDIDKGTGVFVEKKEVEKEAFEDKRQIVIHKLDMAVQFGAELPAPIHADAEIIDTNADNDAIVDDKGNNTNKIKPQISPH